MDHPTTSTLLTWMTFLPVGGAVLILGVVGLRAAGTIGKEMGDQLSRIIALAASALVLALAFVLWRGFDTSNPGVQFVQHARWIPAYNIEYFVGADGISITLIMLTALISFIATIASMPWWPGNAHLDDHHFSVRAVPGYMALLLLLQTGMTGVFVSLDLFLFYVFWEVMLLPMYFLIGIWGGARKEYAAIKFFLYTLAGSVLMLLAIIGLYFNGPMVQVDGQLMHTFDLVKMADWSRTTGGDPVGGDGDGRLRHHQHRLRGLRLPGAEGLEADDRVLVRLAHGLLPAGHEQLHAAGDRRRGAEPVDPRAHQPDAVPHRRGDLRPRPPPQHRGIRRARPAGARVRGPPGPGVLRLARSARAGRVRERVHRVPRFTAGVPDADHHQRQHGDHHRRVLPVGHPAHDAGAAQREVPRPRRRELARAA